MYKKLFIFLFLTLLILACYFLQTKKNKDLQTLLIQIHWDAPILQNFRQVTVKSLINNIVKDELGLKKDFDFDFFTPKEVQRLTLYYVYDMHINGQNLLFDALDSLSKNVIKPQHASIATTVEFFGAHKDELVMMINDPQGEIGKLHEAVKKSVYQANEQYKNTYHIELYNKKKSEEYPFKPHTGLGRLRINHIKENIKDISKANEIIERIKKRVLEDVITLLEKIPSEQLKINFKALAILDLKNRKYLKEYVMN